MPRTVTSVVPRGTLEASPRVLSWVAAMAEALTLPLLLLREDGLLLNANMSGMRELVRGTLLKRDGQHVRPADSEEWPRFQRRLQQALHTRTRHRWGDPSDPEGGRVLIAPVAGSRGGEPMLMVVLPAEATVGDACLLFAYQYGLSEAELDVLHALCTGHTPREIAARRGVSTSTVRSQLARVRRKCGEDAMETLMPKPRHAAAPAEP